MILIFLILIFFILLFLPIYLRVEYLREGEDDNFIFDIYVLIKILGLHIRIPYFQNKLFSLFTEIVTEIDSVFLKLWPWKKYIKIEKEIEWREVQLDRINRLARIIVDKKLNQIILNNLKPRCKTLKWETSFGLSDPALTGITNGFFWILKGMIISLLDQRLIFVNPPALAIYPDFYQKKFSTRLDGIFYLLLGNIILTVIKVLIYKFKGGYRPWVNIQLKN